MTPRSPVPSPRFIAALGLLIAISALSIDIVLPAIPSLAAALGTGERLSQYVVTSYLAGFAVAQVPIGLLSDRLGRRPVMLGALVLFVAAGAGAALAPSILWLCLLRFVQGGAGAAGPVLARAIVRDVGGADGGAGLMATMMAILGLAPLLAPLAGGMLTGLFGWRATLLAIPVYGATTLVAVLACVPETHRPRAGESPLEQLRRSLRELRASPASLAAITLVCLPFAGYLAMITTASTVLIDEYGLAPTWFGAVFALAAAAYSVGAVLSRRLLRGRGTARVLALGMAVLALGGAWLAVAVLLARPPLWLLWSGVSLYILGVSVTAPLATSLALAPLPASAGFAASVVGAAGITAGSLGSLASASAYAGDENSMVAVMVACAGASLLVYLPCRRLLAGALA